MNERESADKSTTPKRLEIIVKRDYQMEANRYGRIAATGRPDNYLDSATVLINGSIRDSKRLRKILMHELGHAFGLRDCSNCRSGATVMNYFSRISVFRMKSRDGNVADRPTVSDIAQVEVGYHQTPAPRTEFAETDAEEGRTIAADEIGVAPEALLPTRKTCSLRT